MNSRFDAPAEPKSQADSRPTERSSMVSLKTALNFKTLSRWLSGESLTEKASLNALATALDYGARLVVSFIMNPLLVVGLGDYSYGVWQILGRLTGYISAASGRPTQALKWTIASQQISTNYEQKRRYVGSAIAVWLLFLPLLTVIGGLVAWFAPSLLNSPREFSWIVRLAAGLLIVDLIVTDLVHLPQSVLLGENLEYKRMGLSAILVFVGGGLTATALYLNTGLVGVAAACLATALLTGAFFLQIVRSYVPWFGVAIPSFADVRGFFSLSGWFLAWRLVSQSLQTGDIVVLGILKSAELVTTYSLTRYASETIIKLIAFVVFSVLPGLGGIIGSGDLQKAVRVRNEIMLITWLIVTPVGTTIVLWNRVFVQLWVGAEYYGGPIPTLLIVLMVTQFVLIRNDGNIIDLTLNLRGKVLIGALSTVVSVVLAGVLVGPFDLGITGLCLGFIVGRSILSLGYPWLVGRSLGISLYAQLKSVLRPAFITVLLYILALSIADVSTVSTWIGLILSSGVTFVVVSLLAFYTGLSDDQRGRILQRVRLLTRPAIVD
jgi:O-antigen/teichoic acid export membrane protein